MATQRALVVREIGKPLELMEDRKIPEPGQGQVQIKVSVAGLNPTDHFSRDWGIIITDMLPAVLGKDVVEKCPSWEKASPASKSGTESSPEQMSRLAGRRAACSSLQLAIQASWPRFRMASPTMKRYVQGLRATLPVNLTTIFGVFLITLGLHAPWAASDREGDACPSSILIVGGGSACGQFAAQVAALIGIAKIVVVGGDEKNLKKRGATHVIDRHSNEEGIVVRVRDIVGDDLIYALDTVDRSAGLGLALKALSTHSKGKLARLLPMGVIDEKTARGHEVLDVLGMLDRQALRVCSETDLFPGNIYFKHPLSVGMWERLPEYLTSKKITATRYAVREPRGLRADVVDAALNEYRDGKRVTKPHIHVA